MRKLFVAILAVASVSLMGTTASAVKYSFENDPGAVGYVSGWQIDPDAWGSTAVPKTAADGVPTGAITDGIYALEAHGGRRDQTPPLWSTLIRGESGLINADLTVNTTLSFDAFIPYTSYDFEGGNFWGEIQVQIEGEEMQGGLTLLEAFNIRQVQQGGAGTAHDLGEAFSFEWVYADDFKFNPDAIWSQLTFAIVGGGPLTPIYLDNIQLTGAPGTPGDFDDDTDVDGADFLEWQRDSSNLSLTDWQAGYGTGNATAALGAVPEPSTLVLLVAASCAGLLGRRRVR